MNVPAFESGHLETGQRGDVFTWVITGKEDQEIFGGAFYSGRRKFLGGVFETSPDESIAGQPPCFTPCSPQDVLQ